MHANQVFFPKNFIWKQVRGGLFQPKFVLPLGPGKKSKQLPTQANNDNNNTFRTRLRS